VACILTQQTYQPEYRRYFPSVEITETPEEFTCTAELPGLTQKDVELSFENSMLLLKGEKKGEKEIEKKRYHVLERTYGSFQRSFTFPASVKSDKISAEFANGVLTVHLPIAKKPEMEAKKIAITAK
jgi:HSP20 family protein